MSGSIVVGYTATDAGADAAALGARLARSLGADAALVIVLPGEDAQRSRPAGRALRGRYIREQAKKWLADAVVRLPQELTRSGHVRFAESFAEGLIAAGEEFGAGVIVVGAADGGLLGRHRLGSVAIRAAALLDRPGGARPRRHRAAGRRRSSRASPRRSARAPAPTRCSRRPSRSPRDSGAELRLVSLVPFDVPAGRSTPARSASSATRTPTRCSREAEPRCPMGVEADGRAGTGRQRRGRRRAPVLAARRGRPRRLEPARAAAPPVPRAPPRRRCCTSCPFP